MANRRKQFTLYIEREDEATVAAFQDHLTRTSVITPRKGAMLQLIFHLGVEEARRRYLQSGGADDVPVVAIPFGLGADPLPAPPSSTTPAPSSSPFGFGTFSNTDDPE